MLEWDKGCYDFSETWGKRRFNVQISGFQPVLREKSQGVRDIKVLSNIETCLLKKTLKGTQVFIFMFGDTRVRKGWEPLV